MRDLLLQIESGLDSNLYLLSLYSALTIPDICGAISSDDGIAKSEKYIEWFDKHVASKYNGFLSGITCYFFRCSLLHQGSSQHEESAYARVFFVEPSATNAIFHNNVIEGAVNIDVRIFCKDIVTGAKQWLDENEETGLYKKNYNKFMRRYPNGLPPYIVGVPVIG